MAEKDRQTEQNDLAAAYHACLAPDYPNPPSEAQKMLVLEDLKRLGMLGSPLYRAGQSHADLAFLEGNRNIVLAIFNRLDRDPLNPKQLKAKTNVSE